MKNVKIHLIALAICGLMTVAAAAQTSSTTSGAGPGKVDPGHPRVNQVNHREQHQQNRIANGIKSDKLTSQQTAHLERGETRLKKNEKRDMAADNGHLTKQDQRQLNHEANRESTRIYKDKHDKR
jgi:predicted transglutaminase-like cysteine proteinase